MDFYQNIQETKLTIGDNDFESAIAQLKNLVEHHHFDSQTRNNFDNTLINIISRNNLLAEKNLKGTLENEILILETNKITEALLDLTEKLREAFESPSNQPKVQVIQPKYLVGVTKTSPLPTFEFIMRMIAKFFSKKGIFRPFQVDKNNYLFVIKGLSVLVLLLLLTNFKEVFHKIDLNPTLRLIDFQSKKIDEEKVDNVLNKEGYAELAKIPEVPKVSQTINLYSEDYLFDYIKNNVDSIQTIWICGAHLQHGVGRIESELVKIINNGGDVRILLTSPKSEFLNILAERHNPRKDPKYIKMTIEYTLQNLAFLRDQLKPEMRNGLTIKVSNFPVDERLHIINPHLEQSSLFVKSYPFKNYGGISYGGLQFFVQNSYAYEDEIYQYYKDKFKSYFQHGELVE